MARPPSNQPLSRSDIEAWVADRRADAARLLRPFETGPARAGWRPAPPPASVAPARQPITREQIRATVDQAVDRLNRSQAGRAVAGVAGEAVGAPVGVLRGGWNMGKGIWDTGAAGVHFTLSSNEEKAATLRALADTAVTAGRYVEAAAAHPDILKRDALALASDANRALNPVATPQAATATDEFNRVFHVGMNQGELGLNVGTLAFAGAPRLGAMSFDKASKLARAVKYAEESRLPMAAAKHLAEPYTGIGHHSVVPQRAKLPAILGGGRYPDFILESPFNKVKPGNIDKERFFRLHRGLDEFAYGGPTKRGLPGWSAKRLGLERYGPAKRIWFGTPDATRGLVGILGATGMAERALDEETNP